MSRPWPVRLWPDAGFGETAPMRCLTEMCGGGPKHLRRDARLGGEASSPPRLGTEHPSRCRGQALITSEPLRGLGFGYMGVNDSVLHLSGGMRMWEQYEGVSASECETLAFTCTASAWACLATAPACSSAATLRPHSNAISSRASKKCGYDSPSCASSLQVAYVMPSIRSGRGPMWVIKKHWDGGGDPRRKSNSCFNT